MSSSPPPANNWYQIIVVLMLATGAFFVQLPLRSERPVPSGSGMKAAGMQDIDARLWQDPIGAALQARQNAKANCLSISTAQASVRPCPEDGKRDLAWLNRQLHKRHGMAGSARIDVLIASVPGGNWVGADEVRRRLRYAVLAGLNAQHRVPADPEHIGYIEYAMDDQKIVIPYEWFEQDAPTSKADRAAPGRSAILLWLDEEALLREMPDEPGGASPLQRLGRFIEALRQPEALCARPVNDECPAPVDGVAVIGPYSSTFLAEADKTLWSQSGSDLLEHFKQVRWYSPYATRAANTLLPLPHFHPMIVDDGKLADGLAEELARRHFGNASGLALVGQWDTTYARSLRVEIKRALRSRGYAGEFIEASYLRGIDGLTAGKKTEADKERDKSAIEHPEGDSQIDYLRRVAVDLKLRERSLGRIGAIGIFGDDYHDKLLVLKALRPEFPTAVFFTTDLNSAMLHPADNPFTRNLVVASGYHLSLAPRLQQDIPPFRDSYQSAGFLATQAALFDLQEQRPAGQIERALASHLFEIGRTRAIPLLSLPASTGTCPDLNQCRTPHPGSQPPPAWSMALVLPGVVLLAGLLVAASGQLQRRQWRDGLQLLLVAALANAAFIAFLHYQPSEREPFSWLQGISIWPTEMLRLAALGLAWWLYRRSGQRLTESAAAISQKYFDQNPAAEACSPGQPAGDIWFAYLREPARSRLAPAHRLPATTRLASLLAALLLTGVLIHFSPLGGITAPIRGDAEVWIDRLVLLPTLAVFLLLVFRCVDATLAGIWLARRLSETTCWPKDLVEKLWPQAGADSGQRALDSWLDAQLIAEATVPIQKMLFYPFAVIALLVIARAPLFDAWFFPLTLVLVFGLIALILVVLALMLRSLAEAVRHKAIAALNEQLLHAQALGQDNVVKQANLLIGQIRGLNVGAFAPFTQQPLIKSALTLGASFSGLALLDYASLMNF